MKLRISDRILAAVAGIILLFCCGGIIAQVFFGVDSLAVMQRFFSDASVKTKVILSVISAALLAIGIYCILILFRHRRSKDKFVVQKTDNGELAISVKALESLVIKCLEQHSELSVDGIWLENQRDGLLVTVKGNVAGGISIPLTIEALQRQVKQYVTACSGVDVKGICVQIDSSGEDAENAPFAIDAPVSKPLLKSAETNVNDAGTTDKKDDMSETEENYEINIEQAAEKETDVMQMPVYTDDEEDDRPLHQRIFSAKNEPCIIPMPPEHNDNNPECDEMFTENDGEQVACGTENSENDAVLDSTYDSGINSECQNGAVEDILQPEKDTEQSVTTEQEEE